MPGSIHQLLFKTPRGRLATPVSGLCADRVPGIPILRCNGSSGLASGSGWNSGILYNLFNHANLNNPDTTQLNTTTFGKITSVSAPRVIELGLRFAF